jgi:NAD(P)-dependent dehydrogenase (short-subunit alcohol dehydrogenase family)
MDNMQNKIILITGATGGIGKQTALALAKMGAQVVITGRNKSNGSQSIRRQLWEIVARAASII